MAGFNYYNNITGSEKCFRIVNFNTNKVWNGTSMVAYADLTSYAAGNVELAYVTNMPGYEVDIPSTLPSGDYDILFFNAPDTTAVAADYEAGFQFTWTGNTIRYLRPRLSDNLA